MRREHYIPLLFCTAILVTSCERDVDFRGNAPSPKMIVNSIVDCSSATHSLDISESVFLFGSNTPQKVDVTSLNIQLNGQDVPVVPNEGEGNTTYYSYNADLSPGDKLEVSGESDLHGRVSGTDYVPFPAEITDLKTEWFTGEKDGMQYLRTLVTIADKPGERNYYRVVIKTKSVGKGQDPASSGWSLQKVYVDQEILFNNIGGVLSGDEDMAKAYRIFSDELIEGETYTLNVYVQLDRGNMNDGWGGEIEIAEQSVKVEIHTLSENLFKYMRSLELAMSENSFSEPVQIFSNITNGYGILGVYNVSETCKTISQARQSH